MASTVKIFMSHVAQCWSRATSRAIFQQLILVYITWNEDQMKFQEVFRGDRMQWGKLEFGQYAGLYVPSGSRHGVLVKSQSEGPHSLVPFRDSVSCYNLLWKEPEKTWRWGWLHSLVPQWLSSLPDHQELTTPHGISFIQSTPSPNPYAPSRSSFQG